MKRSASFLLASLALISPAIAQEPPITDLSRVEGGEFSINRGHARIVFSYDHFGLSTAYGMFTDFTGRLAFDPKRPAASSLEVSVKMDGIDTTLPELDATLKSPKFLDAAKYPEARFKATHIAVTGSTTGLITGDLTLHGVTRPISLSATFTGGATNSFTNAYVLGFDAVGHIKRSDFGAGGFAPMVGDDVTLTISAEFDRQQGSATP